MTPSPTVDDHKTVVMHLYDWNYQDRYYEAPIGFVREFKRRFLKEKNIEPVWAWWTDQIAYTEEEKEKPIRRLKLLDLELDQFFLDWCNPEGSITEWSDEDLSDQGQGGKDEPLPPATGVITEMALCEVPHIFLHPGQLYRFVVMPGCKACEDAATPYRTSMAPVRTVRRSVHHKKEGT